MEFVKTSKMIQKCLNRLLNWGKLKEPTKYKIFESVFEEIFFRILVMLLCTCGGQYQTQE